jgi:hypothetical protein
MLEFIDLKIIFTIFHLLGVVIGMGAAFMTDIMFMYSTRDKVLDAKEISFISLGSRTVWIGLIIIILSGAILFALEPTQYLNSSKFLAKMTVVLVLTINGALFHFKHLPFLRTQVDQDLSLSAIFKNKSLGLFVSGAVSSVSWLSALMLGVFRGVPYNYFTIISVYLMILLVGVLSSFFVRKRFIK